MQMKKSLAMLLIMLIVWLGGCAPLSGLLDNNADEEPLINGTSAGNILNRGFAVKDGPDLLVYYTGGDAFSYGSLVRSNPDTGESSLMMEEGGLYMNIADGMLYYCREDGIYRTPLDLPSPERVAKGAASLLQIADERMFYIIEGTIHCAALDGTDVGFDEIDGAACLNVYHDKLYYIDTAGGQIWQAGMDGTERSVLYDQSVGMFYIIDDVIYFIDSADGSIKRMSLELESLQTVVSDACSGFNVNRSGMYYTRIDDGQCYNAGADGLQEKVIEDFGQSRWHLACMFGEGALVLKEEDVY